MLKRKFSVVSLFTGAGGLDLGLEAAGFFTNLCVEIDEDCKKTLALNRPEWKQASPGDVNVIKSSEILKQAGTTRPRSLDLLAGGPPCQPFSKSGYWASGDSKRLDDPRASTLNAFINLIDKALPRVILMENVKGFTYKGKDEGLKLLQKSFKKINRKNKVNYKIQIIHINCAQFGVPQFRERVFIIAERSGKEFIAPEPRYGDDSTKSIIKPFRTAWDAIGDLEMLMERSLELTGKWADLLPTIPQGENYLWHTPKSKGTPLFGWRTRYWSFLLKLTKHKPSWTIQAAPGPATGPFHWRNRKLSKRELARIQTFPDSYSITGDYRSSHKQIGNAVPPAVGELLGKEILKQFFDVHVTNKETFVPKIRPLKKDQMRLKPVPQKYFYLKGKHSAHPGVGLGPGAVRAGRI